MYWAVLEVLNKFRQVWESIAMFVTVENEFRTAVTRIQETSKAAGASTNEITAGKNHTVNGFVVALYKVTSLMSVFATRTGNHELKSKVDYTESELSDMRPGELLGAAEEALEIIETYQTQLAGYGLEASDVETLRQSAGSFTNTASAPRAAITARKSAGTLLKPQFADAGNLLKEQLDSLMEKFRGSHPAFYEEYWNARQIIDYGTRHEKGGEEDKPQV
jgi:hypothetical protein